MCSTVIELGGVGGSREYAVKYFVSDDFLGDLLEFLLKY